MKIRSADAILASRYFWPAAISSLVLVMVLTAVKDWWLTGDNPNLFFYLTVPIADILGTTIFIFIASRFAKYSVTFIQVLALIVIVSVAMQVLEIIEKVVWHKIWEYPGFLYILATFGLYFALTSSGLNRFFRIKWLSAILISILGLIGGLIAGGILLFLTGTETPGS
jgi:hypothetical protein